MNISSVRWVLLGVTLYSLIGVLAASAAYRFFKRLAENEKDGDGVGAWDKLDPEGKYNPIRYNLEKANLTNGAALVGILWPVVAIALLFGIEIELSIGKKGEEQ